MDSKMRALINSLSNTLTSEAGHSELLRRLQSVHPEITDYTLLKIKPAEPIEDYSRIKSTKLKMTFQTTSMDPATGVTESQEYVLFGKEFKKGTLGYIGADLEGTPPNPSSTTPQSESRLLAAMRQISPFVPDSYGLLDTSPEGTQSSESDKLLVMDYVPKRLDQLLNEGELSAEERDRVLPKVVDTAIITTLLAAYMDLDCTSNALFLHNENTSRLTPRKLVDKYYKAVMNFWFDAPQEVRSDSDFSTNKYRRQTVWVNADGAKIESLLDNLARSLGQSLYTGKSPIHNTGFYPDHILFEESQLIKLKSTPYSLFEGYNFGQEINTAKQTKKDAKQTISSILTDDRNIIRSDLATAHNMQSTDSAISEWINSAENCIFRAFNMSEFYSMAIAKKPDQQYTDLLILQIDSKIKQSMQAEHALGVDSNPQWPNERALASIYETIKRNTAKLEPALTDLITQTQALKSSAQTMCPGLSGIKIIDMRFEPYPSEMSRFYSRCPSDYSDFSEQLRFLTHYFYSRERISKHNLYDRTDTTRLELLTFLDQEAQIGVYDALRRASRLIIEAGSIADARKYSRQKRNELTDKTITRVALELGPKLRGLYGDLNSLIAKTPGIAEKFGELDHNHKLIKLDPDLTKLIDALTQLAENPNYAPHYRS